ncbi:phospholipid--sterol O-acyltransferase isoform X1 [Amborella trichopoda]|uniref:phospholipid--sterol O-acyltransferase isoform X1 n=1 Tax=Amborella trichopoda TaxID=13333 RepID=UPI0009BD5BF8|nr:phospholipid--sterol O-acyltransferase isoform X1 [Amborella trichopoda]|eukprot:XP_020531050.1 phospholipid--sterol O-acyltransferase isoform X1 [Amborella trichopoda]
MASLSLKPLYAIFLLLTLTLTLESIIVRASDSSSHYSKFSGVIIPGFASTQLRAWSVLDCPYSPLDFNPLDAVWLDTRKVLSAVNCWLKCMLLDPYNQTDHPECKSRPDSGLSAITELDPGYITGPLSSVWKDWVRWCIEFGIEANAIMAVPYDWRLSASMLEERDLYFHKLKLTFETALKLRGGPSLVFAHSMGNNVFHYFLEWLKLEIAPKMYNKWLDDHIHAYFAVGAPLLGAPESVKAVLSGVTYGLPIAEGTARLMYNSFGSSLWLLPFSEHCRADNSHWRHLFDGKVRGNNTSHCADVEFQLNFSGWPADIINIEVPSKMGNSSAYPSFAEEANAVTSEMECGMPVQLSFSARELSDGTFFKAIEDYDPDSERLLYQLQKLYHDDPVLNPLTPWDRPPLKNIFCIYGVDMKTEVGYHFAPSGKPYPDNWIVTDVIYEFEQALNSRSGNSVNGNHGHTSGDETVPYHSLSWCKTWLGNRVNVTRSPQSEHEGLDVQVHLNVGHHGRDIVPNMTRAQRVKYITYYEDGESIPGRRTAVWELDKVNHRNIVRSPVLMRELWLEMWHDTHPDAKSKFVTKAKRGPLRHDDCYWDYGKARCAWPDHCEYRYLFGDVHLGQSCRLKISPDDLLSHYL